MGASPKRVNECDAPEIILGRLEYDAAGEFKNAHPMWWQPHLVPASKVGSHGGAD